MAIWVLPVVAVAPVFLARRDPHDTTFPDLLDRTVPLPNPTGASRYDQRLTQRVGVPSRPSAGLERNAAAGGA
jgi:hypothetical protein